MHTPGSLPLFALCSCPCLPVPAPAVCPPLPGCEFLSESLQLLFTLQSFALAAQLVPACVPRRGGTEHDPCSSCCQCISTAIFAAHPWRSYLLRTGAHDAVRRRLPAGQALVGAGRGARNRAQQRPLRPHVLCGQQVSLGLACLYCSACAAVPVLLCLHAR